MIERYSITASPAKIDKRFGTDVLEHIRPKFQRRPHAIAAGNYRIVHGRFYILLGYFAPMVKE